MSKNPAILTGEHFLLGDHAIAEGALAAGCRFFGGYPITPSTETAERMSVRLPQIPGGVYLQMEDEIASIASILGASWAGQKTMTATSGPGFSLMLENLGLGIITETPTVIVNVQRGGPSTGLPTLVGQSDMMQARWGSHGHYEIIALAPWTAQECFDLSIRAFNLAERFRVPVLLMADAEVGHLTEKVVIPEPEKIPIVTRKGPSKPPGQYRCFEPDPLTLVPEMASAGQGYKVFVDSLTHDERGYPVMSAPAHDALVRRLCQKILKFHNEIDDMEERRVEDAEILVVSYGVSARIATRAIELARARGIRAGMLRLKTVWPFPEERIRALSRRVRGIVVPEINLGQIVREVERCSLDACPVRLVGHSGGTLIEADAILEAIVALHEGRVRGRAALARMGA
jgi:2-oxoglutarate ferredoxin oxidoreductase subunit alpha